MQITVSGKNFDVSDSLRDHVVEKLNKKIGRFDTVVTANVTMSTDRHRHIVEITLFGKGFEMRAEEHESDEMYRSVNIVVEKLEKQLDKARSKNLALGRKDREESAEMEAIEPKQESLIKQVTTYAAQPLSVEEAIRELEEKEYSFYAFQNRESGRVNVVYVLDQGGYGLIDAKL